MGFGADAVANGIEVMEALNRISYDLVLMDCQMPEMDGYECSAEIRRREDNTKHMPIIAMTAHVMKADRDKCLAAGMDDFLSKPVRVAHLEDILVRWLTGSTETMAVEVAPSSFDSAADRSDGDAVGNGAPAVESSSSPVDLEILTELAGDNEERLQELAERYIRQTTEQLLKLRDAIATGVAPDVKRIAHSAAGSSAMCGMKPMVALLRELERMGQTNQLAAAPRTYSEAEKEFARIKQFLDARLESAGTPELVNT